MSPQFYLASQSPRRRELLNQAGYRFELLRADIPEQPAAGETPSDYALRIAVEKAQAGQDQAVLALPVLAADTDVSIDGQILGKPLGEGDAVRMLLKLSGRTHEVCSAVALARAGKMATALSVTEVRFDEIDEAMARRYWATGEPAGKAGAYAIQGLGARFVREIRGSYTGVVGLPLAETCELLARFGIQSSA